MGILDEAIKEHLELKRQHGAGESELKQIEDEAFGAAERPGGEGTAPDPLAEAPTQFMAQPDPEEAEAPPVRERSEIADLQEPPGESAEPADEHEPAMEHQALAEPVADEPEPSGPSTEERHVIAEQPTEMYDVEAELGEAEPTDAEPEVHALSEEDEEFWDEKRLSDELDQALEAPVELEEPGVEAEPEEPRSEPVEQETPKPEGEATSEDEEDRRAPQSQHEDVLEDTPDFLEEAPDDDQLWFEQKPPKDFDFDD